MILKALTTFTTHLRTESSNSWGFWTRHDVVEDEAVYWMSWIRISYYSLRRVASLFLQLADSRTPSLTAAEPSGKTEQM